MIKTLKLSDKKTVKLNTSMNWLFIYRAQFGRDILPEILPIAELVTSTLLKLLEGSDGKRISTEEVIKKFDGDLLSNIFIEASSLEFLTLIQIVWALAKNADDSIEDPEIWAGEFETFPIDMVAPEVGKLIAKSCISTKNLMRLKRLIPETKDLVQNLSSSELSSEG